MYNCRRSCFFIKFKFFLKIVFTVVNFFENFLVKYDVIFFLYFCFVVIKKYGLNGSVV